MEGSEIWISFRRIWISFRRTLILFRVGFDFVPTDFEFVPRVLEVGKGVARPRFGVAEKWRYYILQTNKVQTRQGKSKDFP
jgi:hypothetical protein